MGGGREEWERQLGLLLRERPAARGAAGPREWHAWQLFVTALPPAVAAGLGAWGVQVAREGGAVPAGGGSGATPQEEPGESERQELREAVAGVQARLGALEGSVRELERQHEPPASAPSPAAAPAPARARK